VPKTAGTSEPSQASLRLKAPNDFKLVGKDVARLDRAAKTDGSATFTIDFTLPNTEMLTALIRRPPRFGARLKSFDATAARQVKGVKDVVNNLKLQASR
jgi:isoquinoline 1-oxidoreductase beta subunit